MKPKIDWGRVWFDLGRYQAENKFAMNEIGYPENFNLMAAKIQELVEEQLKEEP